MTYRDIDQRMNGPVLLIMEVQDFGDEIAWLQESHPTFASAQEKKNLIEQIVEGARLLKDAGYDDAWSGWSLEPPFGPWDELYPCHVIELSIWAKVGA